MHVIYKKQSTGNYQVVVYRNDDIYVLFNIYFVNELNYPTHNAESGNHG